VLVAIPLFRRLAVAAFALGTLVASGAQAVSFGPFPIVPPSVVSNQDQTLSAVPTGSIALDVPVVPLGAAQTFELTDVTVQAGALTFTLDPTLATPALGVIQPDGNFLIPTLFLVGNDGTSDFDLAIPNLRGVVFGAPDTVLGLFSQFQIDAGSDVFDVAIYAQVPEPGTLSLLLLGCGALALRRREGDAR
jgi:PEP-CTERM motif